MSICIKKIILHGFFIIILVALLALPSSQVMGQDAPGSIRVQSFEVASFTASQAYHGGGDNHYVWTYWYEGLGNLGFGTRICQEFTSPTPVTFAANTPLIGPRLGSIAPSEYIADPFNHTSAFGLQAWETGNSDPCVVHLNNIFWCNRGAELKHFRYIDRPPGITNLIRFARCTDFYLEYRFKYSVPKPIIKTLSSGIACDSGPLTLTAETAINPSVYLFGIFDGTYKFETVWEYRTSSTSWLPIGVSPLRNTPTTPFSDISFPIRELVGPITVSTDVFYRVKNRMTLLQGNGIESAGDIFESEPTEIVDVAGPTATISLSPAPPTINSVSSTPSCSNSNTGIITANVTGIGQGEYLYILRKDENSSPCTNPNDDASNCLGVKSGRVKNIQFNGNNFDITDVAKGRYTLIISNKSGDTGVCYSYVFVDVGEIPPLQLPAPSITNVTCNGGSDGAVTLTAKDGKLPWSYSLTRTGFNIPSNDTGEFTSLTAGTYVATVTDGCGIPVTKSVIIKEPLKIAATVNPLSLQCHSPANGTLEVTITQGEGKYSFKLLKDNQSVATLNDATSNTWTVDNLVSGDYTLEIRDAARLQCEAFTSTFTLAEPASFQIDPTAIIKQNVTCFGKNDGSIQITNANPSAQYNFILTNTVTGKFLESKSNTPKFSGLPVASYKLSMKRNIVGCDDIFEHPTTIEVTQPSEIIVALDIQNVSCFGQEDGSIAARVQGAIEPVQYSWEININGSWATLGNTTTTLPNLSGGTFRFKLIDGNGCSPVLKEAVVIEPALLSFSNVVVNDIKCLGDQGQVEIILAGGVEPYSYTYTSAANTIQSSTSITVVTEGIYSLTATDKNGCQANYAKTISITAPSVPLQFDYILSDFNGYNSSCAGASNAFAQLTATGGNGATYTGYTYALDGTFQANSKIENIPPGAHTLLVKDSRGCLITKDISITEPKIALQATLLQKTNVKCIGDINGQLSITATGGLGPYTYRLSDTQQNQDGIFSNLINGVYTILIRDKNGCTTEYTDEILPMITPIQAVTQVTDLTCNGGKSGSIQVELMGGAQPLTIQWEKDFGNALLINYLPAGDYKFKVTDQQGCSINKTINIKEPDALKMNVTSIPVCAGKATGELRIQASGGTAPFLYSINKGQEYKSNVIFANLSPGTYSVWVLDHNECLSSSTTEIIVRNDLPEPNFIVATAQNALDSLVINEISFPKPDSIEWTFDPSITVTNTDVWAPEITIKEPGDYPISMKGYFGGCDYTKSITLTIKPYDPENRKPVDLALEAIKQVDVSPNPSNGEFTVSVDLNVKQYVSMRVVDVLGINHFNKKWDRTLHVEENIKLDNTASGVFIIQVITDTGAVEKRIIINH
jgi:hypothetical protein